MHTQAHPETKYGRLEDFHSGLTDSPADSPPPLVACNSSQAAAATAPIVYHFCRIICSIRLCTVLASQLSLCVQRTLA